MNLPMSGNCHGDTQYIVRGLSGRRIVPHNHRSYSPHEGDLVIVFFLLDLSSSVILWSIAFAPFGLLSLLASLVKNPQSLALTYAILMPHRTGVISDVIHSREGLRLKTAGASKQLSATPSKKRQKRVSRANSIACSVATPLRVRVS